MHCPEALDEVRADHHVAGHVPDRYVVSQIEGVAGERPGTRREKPKEAAPKVDISVLKTVFVK
jgi:hypothetical protein